MIGEWMAAYQRITDGLSPVEDMTPGEIREVEHRAAAELAILLDGGGTDDGSG